MAKTLEGQSAAGVVWMHSLQLTRRNLLAGTALLLLPAGAVHAAPAGVGRVVTTLTLVNSGGSQQAANFLSPAFGHPFKKGDIPGNEYPQFQLANGTIVPYTFWNKVTWSDGSWKFAGFALRVPAAISGNGKLDLNILSGGAAPAASSRTLMEVANANINVVGVGLDNLTGTWTCSLANAIADARETVIIGDGAAGKLWRILGDFKQGGASHGQLQTYFYVLALQDANGNLAGIRVLPRVAQPWYNLDRPEKHRRTFSSLTLQHGAGPTIFDPIANAFVARTGAFSGSNNAIAAKDHGFNTATGVRYTTTGTPMDGLANNTTYWINGVDANNFQVMVAPQTAGSYVVNVTGAGSGTHTFTPVNYVNHFGGIWLATPEGKYVYVPGGGSAAANSTVRVQFSKPYWVTTKVIPPYRGDIGNVGSNSASAWAANVKSTQWTPSGIANIGTYLSTTGERPDIGPINTYQVRHFYTQSALDERIARTIGLAQTHLCTCIRDAMTLGPLNLGNPTKRYAGMPASLHDTAFFTPPDPELGRPWKHPTDTGLLEVFHPNTYDHMPSLSYYSYLITGEPHYADLIAEAATAALYTTEPDNRNKKVGATTYYATTSTRDQIRTSAWSMRDQTYAAGIYPDVSPDGKGVTAYLRDNAAATAAYMVAWNNAQSDWWKTVGFWQMQDTTSAIGSWHRAYLIYSVCMAYALTENPNFQTMVNHLAKWPVHVQSAWGTWHLASSYERSGGEENGGGLPYIKSDAEWGSEASAELSWSADTGTFTWTSPRWTPSDGDRLQFQPAFYVPAGLSTLRPYYAVQTKGNSFKLSATPGGPPLVIRDSKSGLSGEGTYIVLVKPPTTGFVAGGTSPDEYGSNSYGACSLMKALGAPGLDPVLADLKMRLSDTNWANEPKYAMATSF